MGDLKKVLTFSPIMELFKPEKPKAQPKAAPPVTMQDKNVRQAAAQQSRRLAASSRAKSKVVKAPGSTLG